MRETTMADVAAHLGVSRQLVSIVLRDMPGASEETRKRVRAAATELGYQPHEGARLLRQYHRRQLGVAFTPAHSREADYVEALYDAAAAHGLRLILSARTRSRTPERAIEELLGYRCAALVAIGPELTGATIGSLVERYERPLIAVEPDAATDACDVVRSAGDDGVRGLVRHVAGLGHRRVTYVHTPEMPTGRIRLRGYLEGVREAGVERDVIDVAGCGYTEEAGVAAGRRLLCRTGLPTAVIAANDQVAAGLVLALGRAGVSVPDEVSITGFDDSRLAASTCHDLTTVRVDPDAVAAVVVDAAIRRMASPGNPPEVRIVPVDLVVRGSTVPPR